MNAPDRNTSASRRHRVTWLPIGLLALAAVLSWTVYRADAPAVLPWLLLLACPLMHLFHRGHRHRGQGHHAESGGSNTRRPPPREAP